MEKYETIKEGITIIGLGQMGIRLAELLRDAGHPVNVWNRTISKASKIRNVQITEDIEIAIQRTQVAIICVYDYDAIIEIMFNIKDKSIFKGKNIINLTTGSPDEAANLDSIIKSNGGNYLDGAIQVAPDQMGLPDTTILISGETAVYNQYESELKVLGGNIKYLDSNAATASAMDLATLTWLYGSYIGLLHGAALVEKADLNMNVFSDLVDEITPGFTAFFKHELEIIPTKDFTVSQSPLAISVSATKRIHDAITASGMNNSFSESMSLLLKKADLAGLAGEELAALIKIIHNSETDGK